jgi:hypothetical protein
MSDVLRFEPARQAVVDAYRKATAATALSVASASGLLYGSYRMSRYFVEKGQIDPGSISSVEYALPFVSFLLGQAIAASTLLAAPFGFWKIHSDSGLATTIDTENRKIYQGEDVFNYNAITSAKVIEGPLEKRAGTGSVAVTTLRLVPDQDDGTRPEEKTIVIKYQKNPQKVRDWIAKNMPSSEVLEKRLTGTSSI